MMAQQNPQPTSAMQLLSELFAAGSRERYLQAFSDPVLNQLIPGLSRLEHCDQGTKFHLEGNVAIHTAWVLENLPRVTKERFGREPTYVEYLSALIHDVRKPDTRSPQDDGHVSFPGHEAMAGRDVPGIAERLGLSQSDAKALEFIVGCHGEAHDWRNLSPARREELRASPWVVQLALLQEADARSCLMPKGQELPIFWNEWVGHQN